MEHIVFYRSLGFSLEQIKENLSDIYMDQGAGDLLSWQEQLLYNQIYKLQNSIAAINASQEIAATGMHPPWMLLAALVNSLSKVDLSMWKDVEFSKEQKQIFQQDLQSLDDVLEFYNTWMLFTPQFVLLQTLLATEPIQILRSDNLDWTLVLSSFF